MDEKKEKIDSDISKIVNFYPVSFRKLERSKRSLL